MRIALLEDDLAQADLVKLWLGGAGHAADAATRSRALRREVARESFDLYVLDWELPDMPGIEVLGWLRRNVPEPVPVLFATAREAEEDIVAALSAGADDYVVKPLRKQELVARVSALARRARAAATTSQRMAAGDIVIDLGRRVVTRGGVPVDLTQKDFDLAVFLFRNLGQLVSRGHILESVWGRTADLNTRTVDTHVSRLRSKLGLTPENGWRLSAIYQHGYRLEPLAGGGSANDGERLRQKA
ncbi:MAG: response regulator transcription factor [Burkholderiales bacterium]|nr:response regulator transcription factor [Burkholderiales bacterium]